MSIETTKDGDTRNNTDVPQSTTSNLTRGLVLLEPSLTAPTLTPPMIACGEIAMVVSQATSSSTGLLDTGTSSHFLFATDAKYSTSGKIKRCSEAPIETANGTPGSQLTTVGRIDCVATVMSARGSARLKLTNASLTHGNLTQRLICPGQLAADGYSFKLHGAVLELWNNKNKVLTVDRVNNTYPVVIALHTQRDLAFMSVNNTSKPAATQCVPAPTAESIATTCVNKREAHRNSPPRL